MEAILRRSWPSRAGAALDILDLLDAKAPTAMLAGKALVLLGVDPKAVAIVEALLLAFDVK